MRRNITPLAQLLADQRPSDMPVAFSIARHGKTDPSRDWNSFHSDVASLCARLKTSSNKRWLIAESSAYGLGVAIFGALHADCQAVLPANLQSGHLFNLASTVDGVITGTDDLSFKANTLPIYGAHDGEATELEPLDDDIAEIVLHTSGTTGEPLAIRKPLRCLDAEVAALEEAFGDDLPGNVHATVPAYHIYGLLFRVLWPLATGRTLAARMISYPEELALAVTNTPSSLLVSSPAFLKRVKSVLDLDHLKPHLNFVFSSGGLLPPDVAASYNSKLSRPIVEVYGSTETGGIGYRSVMDAASPAAWAPLPGVELSIDPKKSVLAVKSAFIPDAGWQRTGDLATIGEDGHFKLGGRADRIVKLEEVRVSLSELEKRLESCPEVEAVTIFPLATNKGTRQMLGAVVQPSVIGWDLLVASGKKNMIEVLSKALKPYFSAVSLPRKWRFVKQIPENERGKTTQAMLGNLFIENQNQTVRPVVLKNEVGSESANLRLQLPQDLIYFKGHFDAESILAGVVQVDWAIDFAMDIFPITGPFRRIEALKFFKVLFADQEVSLDLQYDPERGRLNFRYFSGEDKFSSGRVIFEDAA